MILLLVAVGLLVASLTTDQVALAWGSVAVSVAVAAMILVRWRRGRDAPEIETSVLLDDEPVEAVPGGQPAEPAPDTTSVEQPPRPTPVTAAEHAEPVATSTVTAAPDQDVNSAEPGEPDEPDEPGEEDTDAADLLVVYELADEVLVVDEHPRYHLTRCPWPDHAQAERLPVREARELGFTPCDRCRPDTALARRHRAASATTSAS
ncbi:MAG: hypothetical protein ACRDS9_02485 [Pseudonocardiaceae bacterium]